MNGINPSDIFSMSWYRNFLRYLIFSRCHGIEISQISDIFSMSWYLNFLWYFYRCHDGIEFSQISEIFSMPWYRNFSDIWYFIDAMVSKFLRYLIVSRCHGIEISQISDSFSMSWYRNFSDIRNFSMPWYRNFSDIWYFLDVMVSKFLWYLIFSRCSDVEISQIFGIFSMSWYRNFSDIWYFLDANISNFSDICYFLDVMVSKFLWYLIFSRCHGIEIYQIYDIFSMSW